MTTAWPPELFGKTVATVSENEDDLSITLIFTDGSHLRLEPYDDGVATTIRPTFAPADTQDAYQYLADKVDELQAKWADIDKTREAIEAQLKDYSELRERSRKANRAASKAER